MSLTWNWHYIPEKNWTIDADTPMQDIIRLADYRHFLARSVAGILDRLSMNEWDIISEYLWYEDEDSFWIDFYHQNVRGALAMKNALGRESISFRNAWNLHWVPAICGKLHELKWTPVRECRMKGADVCGHPEVSWLYHSLWTGWFIASMLSQRHHNPWPAITKPIALDNKSGKILRRIIKIAPITFKPLHALVKANERVIWERTIFPFRRKVIDTLKEYNFILAK